MKRSKFSLSHTKLLSCNTGYLVPIGLLEVLPGDTIQHNASVMIRCSPLLAPIMHRVDVRVHHWYVPHRLIWAGFEDFITGGPDGNNTDDVPTVTLNDSGTGAVVGDIYDYYGIPTGFNNLTVNALPFRGYNLIWNENYRDQDLQTELTVNTSSSNDPDDRFSLQRVAWEKDYFTAARPWEQKGPSITLPLGTDAPVNLVPHTTDTDPMLVRAAATGTLQANNAIANTGAGGQLRWSGTNIESVLDPNGRLVADLSNASAITVIALREALALQRFEEARARYGSRYVEYLRYLGVRSSDERLQRPEYLGGGSAPIQFSEVLQTAEGDDPVGEMRGHGIGAMRSNRYRRFIQEHGYIHSFLSVRPKTIYASGVPRTFTRSTKEDFWQKELEGIGQQEVLVKELYGDTATGDNVFGFTDRYQEYREQQSSIAGEFRTVLDQWHLARIFASAPALNAAFVRCEPADDRIFAVPSQDVLYVMAKHSIQARRLVAATGKSYIF